MNNREIGTLAENFALEYYKSKGYQFVTRNFRYRRYGEIDLIFKQLLTDGDSCLIFCEVKCRKKGSLEPPSAAVNRKKQNRIRMITSVFLMQHKEFSQMQIRFDIAEVIYSYEKMYINIIENAF